MKKLGNAVLALGFFAIIFSVGIVSWLQTDRTFSPFENRSLAQKPEITKETIADGTFFKEFETYTNDQLFGRDMFIKNYTLAQMNMNKSIVNDIILTEDQWLLKNPAWETKYDEIDQSLLEMEKLAKFAEEKDIELYFASPPSKSNILSFKLPPFITSYGKENAQYFSERLPENVTQMFVTKEFEKTYTKQEREELMFRTDHHWNMDGAFKSYQYFMNTINKHSSIYNGKEIEEEDFTRTCASDKKLIGSFNNQLYQLVDPSDEKLCYYTPKGGFPFTKVTATNVSGTTYHKLDDIYGFDKQKSEVTYAGYYTGDYPEIVFENDNADNDIHALILKDSFTNAITPHLALPFKQTSLLDMRHYYEKSVYQYIKDHDINMVIVMYNDSNLSGEAYRFE
ncbi:hypothetical protein BAMA_24360 [Bacillus manliponensis]|uniref:AlgX/AlgJ SGNH hydrolase-like domain-containing protein n=1 Tax=Bacillus manliponensis TaxID=574376 RepID=A0A073JY43_9BACI|nr:DHHW family protein [Bacillus manliponensis]KEK19147.1 hypothetical protein BAMA_24360 [Bacillus manliponensis]